MCDDMVKQDVLTPLAALLREVRGLQALQQTRPSTVISNLQCDFANVDCGREVDLQSKLCASTSYSSKFFFSVVPFGRVNL